MPDRVKSEPQVKAETEADVKEEQASPTSPKTSQKKKKAATTRRRTKTGCLTCRQRRVKCDEMKPTCHNCEKSRRPCAGYQVAQQIRTPSVSEPFYTSQSHPSPPFNIAHTTIDPISGHYASTAATTPEYTHNLSPNEYPPSYVPNTQHHPAYEYPFLEANMSTDYPRFAPNDWQSSSLHASQAYHYNVHHSLSYDSSSRVPYPSANRPHTTRPGNYTHYHRASEPQCVLAGGRHHHNSYVSGLEEENPNDPWDIESDDERDLQSSLVNRRVLKSVVLDERMSYLLTHFVTVLRPCMSIYERPVIFDGSSTFAEKLPALALSNRGLLHGLLAVSSLQLAVVHHTSEAIPLKHFVVASKRLASLISNPLSRHKVETLGLCLILAFYEVLLGDHARWTLHLRGAAAFVMEHDYAGFARSVRNLRSHAKLRVAHSGVQPSQLSVDSYAQISGLPPALFSDEEWDVDEPLIRKLTGLDTDFANQVQSSAKSIVMEYNLSQDVVQEWRTKLDLMWWFVKMDVFQSILSGDRLLLPYQDWKFFVPRGRIGSTSSVHATMDHLWLVLGRLADFGAKDRSRKLRKMATTGGAWVPEPGFLDPPNRRSESKDAEQGITQKAFPRAGDARANEGRARAPRTAPPSSKGRKPPLFFGMMPPPKIPPSMLSSFHITDAALCAEKSPQPPTPGAPDRNLMEATEAALKQHEAIAAALQTWFESLSADFQNLPPRLAQSQPLFGTVRRYNDPVVACVWSLYHLGKILLRRYHPFSPPAMMMSASVNEAHTRFDAEVIASINVGLLENQAELASAGSINPTLVAALQELSFPLMFAGVQFKEATQRSWAIENLLDLAKYSGWRTAFSVATGLESAWHAQGGYERTLPARSPHDAKKYEPILPTGKIGRTSEEEHHSRFVNHDRRLIDRFSDLRAFWAVGLLSSQEDLHGIMRDLDINRST